MRSICNAQPSIDLQTNQQSSNDQLELPICAALLSAAILLMIHCSLSAMSLMRSIVVGCGCRLCVGCGAGGWNWECGVGGRLCLWLCVLRWVGAVAVAVAYFPFSFRRTADERQEVREYY
jgi:hypothetical protein